MGDYDEFDDLEDLIDFIKTGRILLTKDLDNNKALYLSNNVSDYFYLPQMPIRLPEYFVKSITAQKVD